MTRTCLRFLLNPCVALLCATSAPAQAVLHDVAHLQSGSGAFGDPVVIEGGRLTVGAPLATALGPEAGEAQVYRSDAPFALLQTLYASDTGGRDHFGGTLAMSADVLVVGADRHDHGVTEAGAAYVFRWNGSAFVEEAELLASDRSSADHFGSGVAVSGDWIIVGAPEEEQGALMDRGAVYFFERIAGAWTEVAKLNAPDGTAGDRLGWRVALDGTRALANAPNDDHGSAYTFVRGAGGWSFEHKFLPPAQDLTDTFAFSVDLDGDLVAIGQPYGGLPNTTGAVHLWRNVAGNWVAEAHLVPLYGSALVQFGSGVSLDADRLIVGARGAYVWDQFSGDAFLFERVGGAWLESIKLAPSSGASFDSVGIPVSIQGDRAAVGGANPANDVFVFTLAAHVGTALCAGDGTAAACPCGNESEVGQGRGCRNAYGWGAVLDATGSASIVSDDLVFSLAHAVHSNSFPSYGVPTMLVGSATVQNGGSGVPFGDGLLCLGPVQQRLAVRYTTPYAGLVVFDPGLATQFGWSAGETHYFQVWYRDPNASPCGAHFNTTNALAVTLTP